MQIHGQRYTRDILLTKYVENDYIEQYKDLKSFFEEYVGRQLLNPLISYPDTKTKYPIGIIDLRHQLDHLTLKKIQPFQEYGANPD